MIGSMIDALGKMGIKVYISGNSGNKEIVTHQQRIFMILKSLAIEFEPVDIAGPGMDNQKDVMRAKGKKKEGQRHALPPQIFNGDKYCGDYDDFDLANEDDELEEFLGIPRKTPKSNPVTKQNGHAEGEGEAATNGEAKPADAAGETTAASESAPSEATSAPSGDAEKAAEPSSEAAPTSAEGDKPAAADQEGGGGDEEEEEGEEEEEDGEDYEYEEGEDEA